MSDEIIEISVLTLGLQTFHTNLASGGQQTGRWVHEMQCLFQFTLSGLWKLVPPCGRHDGIVQRNVFVEFAEHPGSWGRVQIPGHIRRVVHQVPYGTFL